MCDNWTGSIVVLNNVVSDQCLAPVAGSAPLAATWLIFPNSKKTKRHLQNIHINLRKKW